MTHFTVDLYLVVIALIDKLLVYSNELLDFQDVNVQVPDVELVLVKFLVTIETLVFVSVRDNFNLSWTDL